MVLEAVGSRLNTVDSTRCARARVWEEEGGVVSMTGEVPTPPRAPRHIHTHMHTQHPHQTPLILPLSITHAR